MHYAAGILSLALVSLSVIGPLSVLVHLFSHRVSTLDVGKHCIWGIALADLLWGLSNVFYLGLSSFDTGFYLHPTDPQGRSLCVWLCEQSAVACSVVGFFGIAANAAVGIWSNCLAHLIYRSVCVDFAQTKLQRAQEALYGIPKHKQEATLPQSSKETRFGMVRYYTRLYSVVGWLLPLAIGLLGLGWSTQNVGLAKVGWLYPNGDLTTDPSPNLRITQP